MSRCCQKCSVKQKNTLPAACKNKNPPEQPCSSHICSLTLLPSHSSYFQALLQKVELILSRLGSEATPVAPHGVWLSQGNLTSDSPSPQLPNRSRSSSNGSHGLATTKSEQLANSKLEATWKELHGLHGELESRLAAMGSKSLHSPGTGTARTTGGGLGGALQGQLLHQRMGSGSHAGRG